jgi:hypothetical protein
MNLEAVNTYEGTHAIHALILNPRYEFDDDLRPWLAVPSISPSELAATERKEINSSWAIQLQIWSVSKRTYH